MATVGTRSIAGFTLVEIALVIGIISLIVGALLPLIAVQSANTRIAATRTRQDTVRAALINYFSQHGYLPCPADGFLLPSSTGYGHEARDTHSVPATSCTLLNNAHSLPDSFAAPGNHPATGALTLYRGVLPWLDLGLPEDSANDGWNQRFSYVVGDSAVTGYATREASVGLLGGLVVCNGIGSTAKVVAPVKTVSDPNKAAPVDDSACQTLTANVLPAVLVGSPAAALISHGENGYGAFIPPQSTTSTAAPVRPYDAAGDAEKANIDITRGKLVQGTYSRDNDDLVIWIANNDLVSAQMSAGTLPSAQALFAGKVNQIKPLVIQAILNNSNIQQYQEKTCQLSYQYQLDESAVCAFTGSAGLRAFCQKNPPPGNFTPWQASAPAVDWSSSATWQYELNDNAGINAGPRSVNNAAKIDFDPWGNPLLFSLMLAPGTPILYGGNAPIPVNPPNAYLIYSAGPDGVFGNEDDLATVVTNADVQAALQAAGRPAGFSASKGNDPHCSGT